MFDKGLFFPHTATSGDACDKLCRAEGSSLKGKRQKNIRTEGLISTEVEEVGSLEFIEKLDIKLRIFWFVDGES